MLIRRKERSIPWTCEYRFERAIPPVAFGLFSFQAFGSLLGRFIKGLVFHQRSDTRFFLTVNRKSIRLRSISGSFLLFSFFLSFLNFSRYILRNVTNKLYTLYSRYFTSSFFKTFFKHFFSPFYAHFSQLFAFFRIFSLFFLSLFSKYFYFPRLQSFRVRFNIEPVLLSPNFSTIPLLKKFTMHFAKEKFR